MNSRNTSSEISVYFLFFCLLYATLKTKGVSSVKVTIHRRYPLNEELKVYTTDKSICSRFNAVYQRKDDNHVYCDCRDNHVFYAVDAQDIPQCHPQSYGVNTGCSCNGKQCIPTLDDFDKITMKRPILNRLCGNTRLTTIEYWSGRDWKRFWASGISMNVTFEAGLQYPMLNFYMMDPYVYYSGHLLRFHVKCRRFGVDAYETCVLAKGIGVYTYEDLYDPYTLNPSSTAQDKAVESDSSSSKAAIISVCCIAVIAAVALMSFAAFRFYKRWRQRNEEPTEMHNEQQQKQNNYLQQYQQHHQQHNKRNSYTNQNFQEDSTLARTKQLNNPLASDPQEQNSYPSLDREYTSGNMSYYMANQYPVHFDAPATISSGI